MPKKKDKKSKAAATPPAVDLQQTEFALAVSQSLGMISMAATEDPPEPSNATPSSVKGGVIPEVSNLKIPSGQPTNWNLDLTQDKLANDIWKFGSGGRRSQYVPVPQDLLPNATKVLTNMGKLKARLIQELGVSPDSMTVEIISGYRTEEANTGTNGAKDSQHMKAKACDFYVYVSLPDGTPVTPVLEQKTVATSKSSRRKVLPVFIDEVIVKMFKDKTLHLGGHHAYGTDFNHYDVRGVAQTWK